MSQVAASFFQLHLSAEWLSALGCFIVACRARRSDIAKRFHSAALIQHGSCPLYRQASRRLLPADSYPGGEPTNDPHRHGYGGDSFSRRN